MILYALVDCNNFYASCERVFKPTLNGKPIVVLSNNDGCVIARSQEAKDLNIKMGVPFWEIKNLIKTHDVQVFSSNYQLYGDMSERVMNLIQEACGDVEIYSIDEAFMLFDTQFSTIEDIEQTCQKLRLKIRQCTSIPVSIGISYTKTLAKLANQLAKKQQITAEKGENREGCIENNKGVFCLIETNNFNQNLSEMSVDKVWGVGRAYKQRLEYYGICTALDLKNANQVWIKKTFGVVLLRTVKELNSFSCLELDDPIESRKNIMVSRSFNKDVYKLAELSEAVSVYATRLGEKLRHYQQTTQHLTVFIWTNPFNRIAADTRIYFAESIVLPHATANTPDLIHYALQILEKLYKSDYNYKKAGILAGELRPNTVLQTNLFHPFEAEKRGRTLMQVLDAVNKKYGKQTLYVATCGQNHTWSRREQFRSPCYTTQWGDILKIK
jgi:DNA polymerase V